MFTLTDSSKKKFLETTKLEREKREKERKEKEIINKQNEACKVIQDWWRRVKNKKECLNKSWNWWDIQANKIIDMDIVDFLQLIGFYCFLSKRNKLVDRRDRLRIIVKYLTRKPYYFKLLIDMRYMIKAKKYLEIIIIQCIEISTISNDLTTFGPELTFLLQYLNPKNYKTKEILNSYYVTDIPDKLLFSCGQTILKSTLCQFNLRSSFIQNVQEIIKLQDRSIKDLNRIKQLKLWLSTMTRLTLFPIENADISSDALDLNTATNFFYLNTLSVPYITCLINTIMLDRIYTLITPHIPTLLLSQQLETISINLSGNGNLFLLANLIEIRTKSKDENDLLSLIDITTTFIKYIEPYFSDKQTPEYINYHPIFKWSKSTWGNDISTSVFDKIMKQIEFIWSRSFMDQIFNDIISFEPTTNKKLLFKSTASGGDIALFSIQVESIFSLYIQLTNLFKSHKKVILYRIAFTTKLMPQLWKLMNQFGPKGNMIIYLDAAKQKDIKKEPLIQILLIFCEACSIVFLTLDDVDIFTHQKPFSPNDLIQLSSFLNNFYFSLIKQHTDIPTEIPPGADLFKSARRLLLQIYDLDLHHPFCPPNHWLLISISKGMKSFFSSIFNESEKASSLFLSNLKQGDPVPLRILQLMPHTVSFDIRLKIFRDWIALDKSIIITKNNGKIISVRRGQVLQDGYHALSTLSSSGWKGTIRVSFVNELGVTEAGIDQGGPFKDFITMLINEAFEPNFGLFCSTKSNSFYPSATSSIHGKNHIQLFEFIGKAIGKALYEGILLDVKFAEFLLAKLLGRNVFLEELKELDAEVWKNLTFIKHYEGDVEELGLSFEADENVFGKVETHELKYRGKNTIVANNNKIEYVYLMADYKLNQRAKEQTKAFIHGFRSVISESWIKLFSPPELQRVLSGEDTDFDISDLRRHTEYQDGYFDLHPVIRLLWQIVGEFSSAEKRSFLKFVTGCPKPPLGGFTYLQPPFTVRMVSVDTIEGPKLVKSFFKLNTNKSGRLPSSSTCFNLLKLPAYTKKSLLKEKLLYAINSNTGFELS